MDINWLLHHPDKVDWDDVCVHCILDEHLIELCKNYVNWDYVSQYQNLSESFIRNNFIYLNWSLILKFQNLSISFLDLCDNAWNSSDWFSIAKYQHLNESFIIKHFDKFSHHECWNMICKRQNLSETFLINHHHLLIWTSISHRQFLSPEFVIRFKDHIDWCAFVSNKKSWDRFVSHPSHIINCFKEFFFLKNNYSSNFFTRNSQLFNRTKIDNVWSSFLSLCTIPVIKIQRAWRLCIVCPEFSICRNRLSREFDDLIKITL